MKTLILIRHAKSSWELFSTDKERDILPIGKKRTEKVAEYLFNSQFSIFNSTKFYSSPAKRAYKTAEIITKKLTATFEILPSLYTFNLFDLSKTIQSFNNQYDNIVIFGHNEAFTEFINTYGNKEIFNLPTSGVAIIEFAIDSWAEISKGNTVEIIIPKEIQH